MKNRSLIHTDRTKEKYKNNRIISFDGEIESYNLDFNKMNQEEQKINNEFKYEYISLLKNRTKPGIYFENEIIDGCDYSILEDKKLLSTSDAFSDSEAPTHEDSGIVYDIDFLSTEKLRYFTANNLTKICFNCEQGGHQRITCPKESTNNLPLCFKCCIRGHVSRDCKNIKCFRCKKIGHKNTECKELNLIKCKKCNNFGHDGLDCLIFPESLQIAFSGNLQSLISKTPDYLMHINTKKNFYIENTEEPNSFKINHTCPRCGEKHHLSNCRQANLNGNKFIREKRQRNYSNY